MHQIEWKQRILRQRWQSTSLSQFDEDKHGIAGKGRTRLEYYPPGTELFSTMNFGNLPMKFERQYTAKVMETLAANTFTPDDAPKTILDAIKLDKEGMCYPAQKYFHDTAHLKGNEVQSFLLRPCLFMAESGIQMFDEKNGHPSKKGVLHEGVRSKFFDWGMARLNEGRHNADACVAKLRPDVQDRVKSRVHTAKGEQAWPMGCVPGREAQKGATNIYCDKVFGPENWADSQPNPPRSMDLRILLTGCRVVKGSAKPHQP